MNRSALLLGAIVSAMVSSCGGDAPRSILASDYGGEYERLYQRASIMVQDRAADGSMGAPYPTTAGALLGDLEGHCRSLVSCGSEPQSCQRSFCEDVTARVCAANALVEMAEVTGHPYEVAGASGAVVVPRQSVYARATLLEWAIDEATQVVAASERTLDASLGGGSPTTCNTGDWAAPFAEGAPESLVRAAAMSLIEGADLVREATLRAADVNVDISDAYFSQEVSDEVAATLAMSAPIQSRSHAAHLIVGGDDGLTNPALAHDASAPSTGALCATPPISGSVASAISLIRAAALSPAALRGTAPLADLLAGIGFPSGSVRERLAEHQPDVYVHTSLSGFLSDVGLQQSDFEQARAYLVSEHYAFARASSAAELQPQSLRGGGETSFARFAGTASPPRLPPEVYYSSLARFYSLPPNDGTHYTPDSDFQPGRGVTHLLEHVHGTVASIVSRVATGSIPSVPFDIETEVVAPLSIFLGTMEDVVGRFTVASDKAYFFYDDAEYKGSVVVFGEDGLRCLSEGSIEGAPCDPEEYLVAPVSEDELSLADIADGAGYSNQSTWLFTAPMDWTRIYLLRPRQGVEPGSMVPGDYEPVSGQWVGPSSTLTSVALAPQLDSYAARILKPNEGWCTRPHLSCAGALFDERLPLENELSDDGDAIETSWRTYLALARDAANEADLLGQRVIADGLEMDRRSESAEARLEQLCGASINTSAIFDDSGSNPASCASGEGCPSGAECVAGVCVMDPAESGRLSPSDAARLEECLADDAIADLVALGSERLCVWRYQGEVCGFPSVAEGEPPSALQGIVCPIVQTSADCVQENIDVPLPVEFGVTWEPVDDTLGYFETSLSAASGSGEPPCDAIRMLRGHPGTERANLAMQEIRASRFFEPERIRSLARAIGYMPHPNATSAVTLGGDPWIETGHALQPGTAMSWPCGSPVVDCSEGESGLFCDSYNCATDDYSLARLNRRLADAVVVIRSITSTGYDGVHLPFMPDLASLYEPAHGQLPTFMVRDFAEVSGTHNGDNWFVRRGTTDVAPGAPSYCGSDTRWITAEERDGIWQYRSAAADCSWRTASVSMYSLGDFLDPPTADSSRRVTRGVLRGLGVVGTSDDSWGLLEQYRVGGAPVDRLAWTAHDICSGVYAHRDAVLERMHDDSLVEELLPVFDYRVPMYCVPDNDLVHSLLRYNQALGSRTVGFGGNAVGDAVEILCEAGRSERASASCGDALVDVQSVRDLPAARETLRCAANAIQRSGSLAVLSQMPRRVVDALREEHASGAFPALGGEYLQAVSNVREGLIELSRYSGRISTQVRLIESQFGRLQRATEEHQLTEELHDWGLVSSISNHVTSCAVSTAQGASADSWGSGFVAAAATCANAAVQIGVAVRSHDLTSQIEDLELRDRIESIQDSIETNALGLEEIGTQVTQSLETIDRGLAHIESVRVASRRALAEAGFLNADLSGVHYSVNTAMRRRYNVGLGRYQGAHERAVRMAFLAKRAIEQRLGVRLSELTEDVFPTVDPPATWEATVCTLDSIEYSDYQDSSASAVSPLTIAEYVDRLEDLVQSYRLVYPFQQGADTSVVSLKEDVIHSRAMCEIGSRNLIASSLRLDQRPWRPSGCAEETSGVGSVNCVGALPLTSGLLAAGESTSPLADDVDWLPRVSPGDQSGQRVVFGDISAPSVECSDATSNCDYREGSVLEQVVTLAQGRYRLSWYGRAPAAHGGIPSDALRARDVDEGVEIDWVGAVQGPSPATPFEWARYWGYFDVEFESDVAISVVPSGSASGVYPEQIDLFGVMLENVTRDPDADGAPPPVVETGSNGSQVSELCADERGDIFRGEWRYGCESLCADGLGACASDARSNVCYWETQVSISQRAIEAGHQFGGAGFARGNFNYRVDTIGLNFVGSRVRDCSESSSPSTCYSSGYVPYSIEHIGPYTVRNHLGEDYDAPLFTGRIEHARGLAAERYLTNPLSSTDRALIEPYMRRELRGRPLDGTYVIRVWDEEGFNFHGIEDVQVVLNYAYWTRTD